MHNAHVSDVDMPVHPPAGLASAALLISVALLAGCVDRHSPAEIITGHSWRFVSGAARGTIYQFGAGQQVETSRPGALDRMSGTYEFVTPTTMRIAVTRSRRQLTLRVAPDWFRDPVRCVGAAG